MTRNRLLLTLALLWSVHSHAALPPVIPPSLSAKRPGACETLVKAFTEDQRRILLEVGDAATSPEPMVSGAEMIKRVLEGIPSCTTPEEYAKLVGAAITPSTEIACAETADAFMERVHPPALDGLSREEMIQLRMSKLGESREIAEAIVRKFTEGRDAALVRRTEPITVDAPGFEKLVAGRMTAYGESREVAEAATTAFLKARAERRAKVPEVMVSPRTGPKTNSLHEYTQGRVKAVGLAQPRLLSDVPFVLYQTGVLAELPPASLDTLVLLEVPDVMGSNASMLSQGLKQAMAALAPGGTLILVSYDEEAQARLKRAERAAGYLDLKARFLRVTVGGALILKR